MSPLPTEINHRIITFGILGSGKGYGECLEALKLLRRDFPEATLTIHGSLVPGKWKEQARFIEQDLMPGIWKRGLDIGARLVLGWPSEVDMQALIAQHSITWLMYHHFDTAWCASASLQMALSACRPVITSWAHHFDVTPDLQSLVYHTDKVEDVARQTAALWRNPEKYHALCQGIQNHAASRGPAELAGEYLGVFEAVLGRFHQSPAVGAGMKDLSPRTPLTSVEPAVLEKTGRKVVSLV